MTHKIKRCHVCKHRFEQRHSRQTFCPVCQRMVSVAVRDLGYIPWGAISRAASLKNEEARQGVSKAAHAAAITGRVGCYPHPENNRPERAQS